MPLNPLAVGTSREPFRATWTGSDALLYAVAIGGGSSELAFTTENSVDVVQQVLPTFALVVGPGRSAWPDFGTYDLASVVHGRQAVALHRSLPLEGDVTIEARVAAMYDKGSAAVVVLENVATDNSDGAPIFTTRSTLFIRGAGGWGGERGSSAAAVAPPAAAPTSVLAGATSPDQALLYRLCGDRNPLHSDPTSARRAGFEAPILHGLCTYGFTARMLLGELCDGQVSRFRSIDGRFTNPVVPGEELTVRAWVTAPGEAVFTTSVGDRVVVDQGSFQYEAAPRADGEMSIPTSAGPQRGRR